MAGEGFNLGNAYGAVIIDVSGVGSAMRQAQSMIADGVSGIGDSISAVGDQMSRLGGAITTFSAPIAAIGGVGIKAAADFDMLMKQIEIFGNVAPDQLDKVSQFALKMGADTKFSSADAAAAMLELLKSGQSVDQAMQTLPDVLDLAATGNLDLARASGIVSSALAIFKLKASDAGRVSNALAQAANATRADVGDLGLGLSNVGPVAAQFGLSIEDVTAVLGVFANNGIMGAEAGTQLKSMLLNMSRPTDVVQGAFEKLGVSLYDSSGNARNFNTVIKELDGALSKLPVQQQNELMHDLAGSYGITGLNALRAAGGIDATLTAMANAPAAGKVAASFMETFKGQIESLTGSFETLMISGLTPFMNDVLRPMVKQVINVVNAMTDWTQKNPELTKQIVKVLGVIAVLGPSLLVAGKALSAIGTIVKVASSSFGLWGIALGALYFAFQSNLFGIRDLVEPFVENFINNIGEIWGSISNFTKTLEESGLGTAIASIIDSVMEALGLAANSDEMDQFAQGLGDGIANAVGTAMNFIQTVAIPTIQLFVQVLSGIWSIVAPVLGSLASWFLESALPSILNFINTNVIPVLGVFVGTLSTLWQQASPALQSLWLWFTQNGLPFILQALADFKANYIQPVIDRLVELWTVVKPKLDDLSKTFAEATDSAQKLMSIGLLVLIETLSKAAGAAKELVDIGLIVVIDTLNKAAISAGLLVLIIEIGVLQALRDFNTSVTELPSKIQGWIDKQGFIVQRFEDLILGIGIVLGLMKLYSVAAGIAAVLSASAAGGVGAITLAIHALLGPIGLAIIAVTTLIALYHQLKTLQEQVQAAMASAAPATAQAISNGMTLQQFEDKAFASFVAQFGDVQARIWWQSFGKQMTDNLWVSQGGKMDKGGTGMAGVAYQIGPSQLKNEVYIPGADGQFVSGFVDLMKQVAAGVDSGQQFGDINVMMPEKALANPAAAYAAGQEFGRGVKEEMNARGVKW